MVLTCSVCGSSYLHRQSLTRHYKALHPTVKNNSASSSAPAAPTFICGVCAKPESFQSKHDFILHVSSVHDTLISSDTEHFDSVDDFRAWKTEVEQKTCAFYRKARGTDHNKNSQNMKFVCNRSGYYLPSGKGIRHLKTQGSRKIGAYCPSEMKLKIEKNGKCTVHFVKTHWGHGRELAHISLTAAERSAIANKIAAKVPLSEILYGVRQNVSNPDEIKRVDLLTKRDIHNIVASFNLGCEYKKHECDVLSVDAWVKAIIGQEIECVLFYKPQGSPCERFPALKNEDFFLAFMTNAQASMLERYGGDIVCADGTHGRNAYHFELVTLMVVDDLREGFPCAFLFTNRTDKDTLAVFFSKIKDRLEGRMPTPKVFMSDMEDSFYNGWIEVMDDPPEKRVYCTWHVDRDWQKNLVKVCSVEKQSLMYKMIRSLLEEVDETVFTENLTVAVERMLDDPDTQAFGDYFKDDYAQNPRLWAYCYSLRCGVNANMYVDSLHECLKYIELEMEKVNRLDMGLVAVLKFLSNKTYDRIITLHKGKMSAKLKNIRSRHETSTGMNIDKVIQNGSEWSVAPSDGKGIYTVSMLKEICSCELFCAECDACIHHYVCTCLDSLISCNMCQHVHLVLTKIRETECGETEDCQEAEPHDEFPQLPTDDGETNEFLFTQVWNEDNALSRVKQETVAILKNVMTQVENSTSVDEIAAAKKLAIAILPAMAAVRESSGPNGKFPKQ